MKLLVRLAAILGGSVLYALAARNLFPSDDANIGAGLLFFALLLTVSGLWGLWDGYHAGALPPVFVRWAVVAVVVGLSGPLQIWVEEGRDLDVLWSDLLNLAPFIAGLVLAPAAVGIAIGAAFRNLPSRTQQHPSH